MPTNHRTNVKPNKPFKGRHATKSALKEKAKGRLPGSGPTSSARRSRSSHTPSVAESKLARRNQAKQVQKTKRAQIVEDQRVFKGRGAVPRVVAVVELGQGLDARRAVRELRGALSQGDDDDQHDDDAKSRHQPVVTVDASRFKTSLQFLFPPARDFYATLDSCKAADYVVFLLSDETDVDPWGETLLRALQAQGVPEVVAVVQSPNPPSPPVSPPQATLKSLHSFLSYFFPTLTRVYATATRTDAAVCVRALCEGSPRAVRWREGRAWLVQDGETPVAFLPSTSGNASSSTPTTTSAPGQDEGAEEKGTVVVRGYVRGGRLSANRLVHLPNLGDFQLDKILACPPPSTAAAGPARPPPVHAMATDDAGASSVLSAFDPSAADTLESLNEPDFMANEQTWPTEEEMAGGGHHHHDDDDDRPMREENGIPEARRGTTPRAIRKVVPKGTSAYQAAWIGSDDDEEDDDDDDDDSAMSTDDDDDEADERLAARADVDGMDGLDGRAAPTATVTAADDEDEDEEVEVESRRGGESASVRFTDRDEVEEQARLAEYKRSRETADATDLEFPDEVDTPMDVPARTRFQRFRGLRSFRTSPWDPYENLPVDYARIFGFRNYEQTGRKVMQEAQEEGVPVGTHVEVHIKDVPRAMFDSLNPARPFFLFGLFEHEHKQSVLNFVVQRNTEYAEPVRSKDALILCVGPRRYRVNPIYSQHVRGGGKGANNVHKSERFLRPGQATVATVYGPIVFGRQPCLLLREDEADEQAPQLVASGSFFNADTTRINAKRILLTGHPVKIHKKTVTVSLMFFNADDVRYFAPVQLVTKWGAVGHISEPLGTHGQYKAHFDKPIKALDVVCMSLYKRMFPKFATPHRVGSLAEIDDDDEAEGMDLE